MSVTRDTSHSPIRPWGPFGQSPFGDSLRYVSTAFLSTALDCGENAVTGEGGTIVSPKQEGLGGVERKHWSVMVKVYISTRAIDHVDI